MFCPFLANSFVFLLIIVTFPLNNIFKEELELSENLTIAPLLSFFCRVKKTMTGNYHKLDLVNIDAHTKFGLIMSIRSQDIERKRNSDLNKWP